MVSKHGRHKLLIMKEELIMKSIDSKDDKDDNQGKMLSTQCLQNYLEKNVLEIVQCIFLREGL